MEHAAAAAQATARMLLMTLATAAGTNVHASYASAAAAAHPSAVPQEQDLSEQTDIALPPPQAPSEPHGFDVHGGALVSCVGNVGPNLGINLILAQVELRYHGAHLGLYAMPRLKIAPVGTREDRGDLFLQQAYAAYLHPWGQLKVGKVAVVFGRNWDYGIYGPLVANYGIKTQSDLGISFEGSLRLGGLIFLNYAVQYFAADGHSLAPLQNADVPSTRNVRRYNAISGSVGPQYADDHGKRVGLHLSAQTHQLNIDIGPRVTRLALHVDYARGPLVAFVEVGGQHGTDVVIETDTHLPANTFAWAGIKYTLGPVDVRYHVNVLRFDSSPGGQEILHQPGVGMEVAEHLAVAVEGVVWTANNQATKQSDRYKERSLYVVANGKF